MKRTTNILVNIALLLGVASCSSEAPFSRETGEGEGRFLSSAMSVELKTDEKLVRATGVPDVNDFTVEFVSADDAEKIVDRYTYGKMPEVVTLPVGDYVVRAYYGGEYEEGGDAAFSAPYYLGESERFSIEKDKIKDNIGTIVCRLSNVKVTILFDESLVRVMSPDSKVSVKVGDSGSLDFTKDTQESGYFAYVEGSSTMAAVFSGVVDGDETIETKTYDNVMPGNHYRITFKLHVVDPNEPGDINPGAPGDEIKIDATVNLEDLTGNGGTNINPDDEDIFMDDDRYPNEEDPTPGPGPDEPGPDEPSNGPTVTANDKINLDDVNIVEDEMECVLYINSETGITGFTVVIESDKLTPDELESVNLSDKLDLVTTPNPFETQLRNFGFLPSDKNSLAGEKKVELSITPFLELLGALGSGNHNFIITVSDEGGETSKTLRLKTIENN